MDGYSVKEAASILGIPKQRVWELIARGVLAGQSEVSGAMRVFLQPQAPKVPEPAAPVVRPSNGNGNGGGASVHDLGAFRDLLTEFRNLTERYGQALLALGEARGEVAALRTRVELLEARMEIRLPGPSAASLASTPWQPPATERLGADEPEAPDAPAATDGAGVAGQETSTSAEGSSSEGSRSESTEADGGAAATAGPGSPAEPEIANASLGAGGAPRIEPAFEPLPVAPFEAVEPTVPLEVAAPEGEALAEPGRRPRRRRGGSRSAVEGIAQALARADDPASGGLPGGLETAEALQALRHEMAAASSRGVSAFVADAEDDIAEPALASAIDVDEMFADDRLGGTALEEQAPATPAEPQAGIASAPTESVEEEASPQSEASSVSGDEIESVIAQAAAVLPPGYSTSWEEPDWIAEEDLLEEPVEAASSTAEEQGRSEVAIAPEPDARDEDSSTEAVLPTDEWEPAIGNWSASPEASYKSDLSYEPTEPTGPAEPSESAETAEPMAIEPQGDTATEPLSGTDAAAVVVVGSVMEPELASGLGPGTSAEQIHVRAEPTEPDEQAEPVESGEHVEPMATAEADAVGEPDTWTDTAPTVEHVLVIEPGAIESESLAEIVSAIEPERMADSESAIEPEAVDKAESAPILEGTPVGPEQLERPEEAFLEDESALEPEPNVEPESTLEPAVAIERAWEPEPQIGAPPDAMRTQPSVPTLSSPAEARTRSADDEEELMWLGDEFGAPTTSPFGARSVPPSSPRPAPGTLPGFEDTLGRMAAERGWEPSEITAIRALLAGPSRQSVGDEPEPEQLEAAAAAASDLGGEPVAEEPDSELASSELNSEQEFPDEVTAAISVEEAARERGGVGDDAAGADEMEVAIGSAEGEPIGTVAPDASEQPEGRRASSVWVEPGPLQGLRDAMAAVDEGDELLGWEQSTRYSASGADGSVARHEQANTAVDESEARPIDPIPSEPAPLQAEASESQPLEPPLPEPQPQADSPQPQVAAAQPPEPRPGVGQPAATERQFPLRSTMRASIPAASSGEEPDWLHDRRGPAADAYRRLRRLFPR